MTGANQTPAGASKATKATNCRWLGLIMVLAPMLTRAMAPTSTLPGWELDPTFFSISTPAMGPGGSMLVDALSLLGAALLLLSEGLAGRRVGLWWIAGALIGSVVVLLYGWWWQAIGSAAPHGTLGNQRIGIAWAAAIWSLVAIIHAAREPPVRRVVLSLLLAFVVVLGLRGAQQVFIDHPITVAAFNADRERWLASKGWSEDSPMAKAYIRRMSQPEATGWFGLSNVAASFGAFGVAAAGAWVWSLTRREVDRHSSKLPLLGAAVSLAGAAATLYFTDAKGGYVVAGVGITLVVLAYLSARLTIARRFAPVIGPVCIFGVLAAVVLRGLIGERISELSILFRWFYMQASARIFAAHPLTGVGPDGYQLAYLLAKNPLNPEEVTSPHSILMDWLSTLGIAGFAWAALLVAAAVLLGRRLLKQPGHEESADPGSTRAASRAGMLTLAAATIAAAWLESPYITPDTALLRVTGLVIGCAIIQAALATNSERGLRIGLCAGALAMLAHAQIELTASNLAACGLFMTAIGAGAAGDLRGAGSVRAGPAIVGAMLCAALSGLTLAAGARPARHWEVDLKQAAQLLSPVAEVGERSHALSEPPRPGEPREDPARLLQDVSRLIGRPVAPGREAWQAAMAALDHKFLPLAAERLRQAQSRYPDEWRVGREIGRLELRLLATTESNSTLRTELRARAIAAIPSCVPPADPDRAALNPSRLRAQSLVFETLAAGAAGPDLETAADLLQAAHALDPYNLDIAVKLTELNQRLGRQPEVERWARKALELDGRTRLDRETRGLSPPQRAELERLARGGAGSPPRSGGQPPP